ncbi:MAG: type VI secretion system baseplate subunit TssE [Phycisphaerales bacterium]|nr:type VI secretion system baseplate subunit TssE [Phycisphaerales bacterium]
MAELTNRERIQPCLLDRLTDEEPQTKVESRDKRVMTSQQVRRSVMRDLAWLLNTSQRFSRGELDDFRQVATSVINYGIPDMVGLTASGVDPASVERRILEAIQLYEPRIMRRGLAIRAVADQEQMSPNAVSFEIKGDLWAQPLPEAMYVKTSVDLETGQASVQDKPYG